MDEFLLKKLQILLLSLVVLCIVLTAGCTGSGDSSPAQTEVQTQATEDQGSSETAVTYEAVHNSKLKEFLPTATSNWESSEASGFQMDDGEYSWSWATKSYTQKLGGEAVVDIVIQDTAGEYVGYMADWDSYIEIDTPDASMVRTTVQGYPGWVITNKEENLITQIINVNDRFIVYTSVSDGKEDYLTVFNNQMNLKGLAALA